VVAVLAVATALSIWFGGLALAARRGWGCVAGSLAAVRYGSPYQGSSGCMADAAWMDVTASLWLHGLGCGKGCCLGFGSGWVWYEELISNWAPSIYDMRTDWTGRPAGWCVRCIFSWKFCFCGCCGLVVAIVLAAWIWLRGSGCLAVAGLGC
jgi:hypothetical protein